VLDWLSKVSLVVATALAGYLLGPYLSNRWQDHKEGLDRRSALVERISNSTGKFVGAARAEAYRNPTAASAFDRAYVDWQVESEAIYTQIAAYIDAAAAEKWSDFEYDMKWVYYVFKRNGAVKPAFALQRIADYLRRPISTLDGLLHSPFRADARNVNPTYEDDLSELTLQLRMKERAIVSDVLD